ncbi:peptidase M24, structural domain-containing protein [Tirmania nivea]|nr:peptidase M24, structural domain-containing protein [Tirmania nivea]
MTEVENAKPKTEEIDYSLANPDTVTKYKDAAAISQKVLLEIEKAAVDGANLVSLCEKGDKLLEDETAKVYNSKKVKVTKGIAFPTTVSPGDIVTPYSPLSTDADEASKTLKAGQLVKIQLGAHIDGFPAIVGSTIIVASASGETPAPTPAQADLLLATHYTIELLYRMMLPPTVDTTGVPTAEGEKKETKKPYTSTQINTVLKKVAETYGVTLVESTTTYQLERNEIEAKKRIVVNPQEGIKSEGNPEVAEAWGVEIALSNGSGKTKVLELRPTLLRKTGMTFMLKRTTSKQTYSEVAKKFGSFPFSLRQLSDERTAKMGVLECVRGKLLRQYEVQGEKDGREVSRVFSTIIITKNGIQKVTGPSKSLLEIAGDISYKKITDEEVLRILEMPLNKNKPKSKKK